MTGLALATAVAKWISYYNHDGDLGHASEYFSFDPDHIAVIDTEDLIHLMTQYPKKNSVRVIDDCGAAIGFTNRRSMSRESLDTMSIYGTNRVRNCATIICVQDTSFTDLRMRLLANEIIDLRDFYQSGPLRFGRLWKIKMDNTRKGGVKLCRFMTYEHGEWVTQERIATFLPPEDLMAQYNELRERKDRENTEKLYEKYQGKEEEVDDDRERCPECGSPKLYHGKKHTTCRGCGHAY
jgi:hypothetical protein